MRPARPKTLPPITDEEEARIQDGIAEDFDNPELTDAELASMRPAREVLPPDVFTALVKRRPGQRGPGKKPAMVTMNIRVAEHVRDAWRASGDGWQARARAVLARSAPKRNRRA